MCIMKVMIDDKVIRDVMLCNAVEKRGRRIRLENFSTDRVGPVWKY